MNRLRVPGSTVPPGPGPTRTRRLHLLRFAKSAKTLCNLPAGPESVVLLATPPMVRPDLRGELCSACVKRFHVIR